MASNDEFFAAQKPAAVLKHGVLMRYAVYFAGKAGSRTGNRIAYVDGYAGPGRYDDGNPASPLLFLETAEHIGDFHRHARCLFVESRPEYAATLQSEINAHAAHRDTAVINDTFEKAISEVLGRTASDATLIFVDPFSLGINAEQLVHLLSHSRPERPIDVIYHFSDHAVARIAERVVQAHPDEDVDQMARRIDALLDQTDWRHEFSNKGENQRPYEIAARLARSFAAQVARTSGAHSVTIDVRQRPNHLPIYSLCLFTKYKRAIWDFVDIAGSAHVDWIVRCDTDDRAAYMNALELSGQGTLFEPREVERTAIDSAIGEQVIPYLIERIPRLLSNGPRRFVDDPELILGDMHGRARTTHVRTALKSLYQQGVVDTDGKGDFFMTPIALAD